MAEAGEVLVMSFSLLRSDARVLRQLRLLTAEGHRVSTLGYGEAPDGVVEHLRIPDDVVSWHKDRARLMTRRFRAAYRTAPVVRAATRLLAGREARYDVVLANDIDTLPLALDVAPRGGVHADLHEYHSRQREELLRWRLFVAPYYRWLVRTFGPRADSVTTVGQRLAEQYEQEFGLRCGVVYNAPERSDLPVGEVGDPVRLVHAGHATPGRLGTVLEAMELVTSGATLDLYLVQGGGYAAELAERYADHPRVRVHDAVPPADLVRTLNRYDVGIHILAPVSFNHRYAMPNKLFDYVQARLGVLIGPSPEMAAMVREHDVGWVTEDFTASDVARTIDGLTREDVARAKAASDVAAGVLCAEEQVAGWAEPVGELVRKAYGSS
ncbi:glycosyltransferase [Ornithinimicrobium sufpigmenti]|uniref:glycosyltransferase n=1 Tax=Ornithinimicrobium sufpigmenti TaxID=2508882 RepID=UPI001EDFDE27|nr:MULTISPECIES: glycosyltransferase [unclassified Ornithinimicrobium]